MSIQQAVIVQEKDLKQLEYPPWGIKKKVGSLNVKYAAVTLASLGERETHSPPQSFHVMHTARTNTASANLDFATCASFFLRLVSLSPPYRSLLRLNYQKCSLASPKSNWQEAVVHIPPSHLCGEASFPDIPTPSTRPCSQLPTIVADLDRAITDIAPVMKRVWDP